MLKELTYIEELGYNYLKEVNILLSLDTYISKKKYDALMDKYSDLFENLASSESKVLNQIKDLSNKIDSIVMHHNEIFLNRKLIEHKDYFDNMFKNIDSNIKLDNDQRKAILIDEDYSLIIAGAGSGKTTTMAAKVKYLIEKCNINPSRIIIMSFTNKATQELEDRINNEFKLGAKVTTFHKLGFEILSKKYQKKLLPVNDDTKKSILNDIFVKEIFRNKKLLKQAMKSFELQIKFDKKCLKYDTYEEYYKYHIKKNYKKVKKNLAKFNKDHISNRINKLMSINGEFLKSKEEVKIANFLFECNIPYEYEKPYPYQLQNKTTYLPDFTIENNSKVYYLEYFGLTEYHTKSHFSIDDISYYNRIVELKKRTHKFYNTNLIEILSSDKTLEKLREELTKNKFYLDKKDEKSIYERLMETSSKYLYYDFIELAAKFIGRFKEQNYKDEDFSDLKSKSQNQEIKDQIDFMKIMYILYNKYIHEKGMVDFEDMINYSTMGMNEYKKKVKNVDYDYIIVDEYQDVSTQKYNFIKNLSDIFEAKIVAVGDDWQAIFGFSGSDVKLFTNFTEMMSYAEIIKITNTYRNSQELIDVAGEFVSRDLSHYQKRLISNKHLDSPVEIDYYDKHSKKSELVNAIIEQISFENKEYKILLLGRYKDDIDELVQSQYFRLESREKGKIIWKNNHNIDISFLTVHSAKGLGYDQVIIINALNSKKGFPSKIENDPLMNIFDEKDNVEIAYPEERRLFYVALTRTKNRVFIICPKDNPSEFISEIKNYSNVVEKHYIL